MRCICLLSLEKDPRKTARGDTKKTSCKYCYNAFDTPKLKLTPYRCSKCKVAVCWDHNYAYHRWLKGEGGN